MGARDGINEGQSKSVTVRSASFHPALKEMLKHLRIEARSIVLED
jgi:hypothetical protein